MDDKYVHALGRIVISFSGLEQGIAFGIVCMVSPEQAIGQIVASQLSFSEKTAVLDSLVRHKLAKNEPNNLQLLSQVHDILKSANIAAEKRNTFMHSAWMVDESDQTDVSRFKYTAKFGKGLVMTFPPVSVDELNALANEISDLTRKLLELLIRIERDFPAAISGSV